MQKLDRTRLLSLEAYAEQRPAIRARVIEHKKSRRVVLGEHAMLMFEDFQTMQYQVQEMLRAERIFEGAEIDEEIAAYNPLIPDGSNWKATLSIEYEDVAERRAALAQLVGVEHRVWVQIGDEPRVHAIANEDLPRSTDEKTSAVHFLRFELTPAMVAKAKTAAPIGVGIDHPKLSCGIDALPESTRVSLVADLG
jgi:hypothetical protein